MLSDADPRFAMKPARHHIGAKRRRPEAIRLSLAPLSKPLDFVGCPELVADVEVSLRGWGASRGVPARGMAPLVSFEKWRQRYHWVSSTLEQPVKWNKRLPRSAFSVLCDIQYELSDWFLVENPDYLCLHCAAVRMGDGAIIIPADGKAGKSTLIAHLAMAGHQVMCDDVLAITPGRPRAMSLGLLPRLRLPLSEGAAASYRDFVAARRGPSDRFYQYLALGPDEFAPYGTKLPIRAIVLLDRRDAGDVAIEPVGAGEVLKHMIRKNFAEEGDVGKIFDRLLRVAVSARRLRLRYARCEDAVAVLRREFAA